MQPGHSTNDSKLMPQEFLRPINQGLVRNFYMEIQGDIPLQNAFCPMDSARRHWCCRAPDMSGQGGCSHRALPINSRLIIAESQVHNSIELLNTVLRSKMLLFTLLSYILRGDLSFYCIVFLNTAALENLLMPIYGCVGLFWSLEFKRFIDHSTITVPLPQL